MDIAPADTRVQTTPGFETPPVLLASDLQDTYILVCVNLFLLWGRDSYTVGQDLEV